MRPLLIGLAMFKPKPREARIRFEKIEKDEDAPAKEKIFTEDAVKLITERGKDAVKFIAIAVVSTYATIKIIDTASQIAVKKTKSADNN
jgi:hypothetical protein